MQKHYDYSADVHSAQYAVFVLTGDFLISTITSNSINKLTRCAFCMYLFHNLFATQRVSNDYFFHHQEFINYQFQP